MANTKLDVGFRVFRCAARDESVAATVTDIFLKLGYQLDSDVRIVDSIKTNIIYKVTSRAKPTEGCWMLICLDPKVSDETVQVLSLLRNVQMVFMDGVLKGEQKKLLAEKNQVLTYSTERNDSVEKQCHYSDCIADILELYSRNSGALTREKIITKKDLKNLAMVLAGIGESLPVFTKFGGYSEIVKGEDKIWLREPEAERR